MRVFGMLWIAHGSRDSKWVAMLDQAFLQVRHLWKGPATMSFLELVDGRLIQDGIDELERAGATDIIVVPMFISSGSTHSEEIAWALQLIPVPYHETDMEPFRISSKIHWCGPMNEAPEVLEMITERVKSISTDPQNECMILVGHGSIVPIFARAWEKQLGRIAEFIKKETAIQQWDFGTILPETVHEIVKKWNRLQPETTLLVVPLFISPGYYTNKKIPQLLAETNHRYCQETLLPDQRVANWAIRVALDRRSMEEENR